MHVYATVCISPTHLLCVLSVMYCNYGDSKHYTVIVMAIEYTVKKLFQKVGKKTTTPAEY